MVMDITMRVREKHKHCTHPSGEESVGGKEGASGRRGKLMRSLLILLSIALMLLISDPALAQTAADDQYGSSGVGSAAATDALRASRAFDDGSGAEAAISEEGAAYAAEEGVAVAAEATTALSDAEAPSAEETTSEETTKTEAADAEAGVKIDSLPDTGGISVVLLGVLLVAGGVLIRALAR
jgi:hypothetical protein